MWKVDAIFALSLFESYGSTDGVCCVLENLSATSLSCQSFSCLLGRLRYIARQRVTLFRSVCLTM